MRTQVLARAPLVGARLAGGYELIRFLGAGGMGAVYEAITPDGEHLAVKVMLVEAARGESGRTNLKRFAREAELAAALRSAHIPAIRDMTVDPTLGVPFMVMPLLVGIDLKQLLDRIGTLHPTTAVRIVRQVCSALQVAHDAGVVHRDIKPGNLFLVHDQTGQVTVKVLDFGIAKWAERSGQLTATGTAFGTPTYMSPEQVKSAKHADGRADVWSLGIVLYRALTGRTPWHEHSGAAQVYAAIILHDIPPLQDAAPWVDPGLARVVHGALVRDSELRCPSIAALAEGLQAHAYGTDELRADMLVPPDTRLRAHRAERAQAPAAWQHIDQTAAPERTETAIIECTEDPLLGAVLADRFQLLRCLGEGGMGAVYEARGPSGNHHALKVLDPARAGSDTTALQRFAREARAAGSIHSEHVVQVLETGIDATRQLPFIVMELLHGVDLGVRIERHGALLPTTAVRVFLQACSALAEAHARGLVHRDVKPSNIFLHRRPSGEVIVKMCDFGIAKDLGADERGENATKMTRTGNVLGSPAYMSPEQVRSAHRVDHRTDVWSLGISLFQALAGEHPWGNRQTVGDLLVAICAEPLPHLQDQAPWVAPGLAEVVHRAAHRNPDERFQTVEELAGALQPFSEGTAALQGEQLAPLPLPLRSAVQPRASASGRSATAGGSAMEAASLAQPSSTRRQGRVWLIAAGAAALLLGLGIVWARSDGPLRAVDPSFTASPALAASEVPGRDAPGVEARSQHVAITVVPDTAAVEVDGDPRALDAGVLHLVAEPGETFAIVVRHGDRQLEESVVVTRDGRAQPDRLVLGPSERPEAGSPAGSSGSPSSPGTVPRTGAATSPAKPPGQGNTMRPVEDW